MLLTGLLAGLLAPTNICPFPSFAHQSLIAGWVLWMPQSDQPGSMIHLDTSKDDETE